MEQISKETKNLLATTGEEDVPKLLVPTPASADRMTPGDIIVFRYYSGTGPGSRSQRTALIIKTRRGDGSFISTQNNLLISCMELNGGSSAVIESIAENLYKKRRRSSYYGKIKESLVALLGVDSFRTYKLTQMKSIFKVVM
jgi:hypothetical protein